MLNFEPARAVLDDMLQRPGLIGQLLSKTIVLTAEDCIGLVETGLQREVRVALKA